MAEKKKSTKKKAMPTVADAIKPIEHEALDAAAETSKTAKPKKDKPAGVEVTPVKKCIVCGKIIREGVPCFTVLDGPICSMACVSKFGKRASLR